MKAILFDFDGVIVDSEPLHFESFCEVLRPYGIRIDHAHYNRNYLGYNDREVLEMMRDDSDDISFSDSEILQIVSQKTAIMQREFKSRPPVLPGVLELMRQALQEKIRLAVFSGALREEVHLTLKTLGIFDFFGSVLTADDVTPGKPNPLGYLMSAEKLGVVPCDCLVVEDSPVGLAAAKAAGMKACALTTTYERAALTAADMIVPNLSYVTLDGLRAIF